MAPPVLYKKVKSAINNKQRENGNLPVHLIRKKSVLFTTLYFYLALAFQ